MSILGKNATALLLWGSDGAILMQAYHFIFAVGTIVSPWIAAPFILQDQRDALNSTETFHVTSTTTNFLTSLNPVYDNVNSIPADPQEMTRVQYSYKNNHCSEGIRYANARTKVIIFCKSRPSNWQLKRI